MNWKILGSAQRFWRFGDTNDTTFSFDVANEDEARQAALGILGGHRDPRNALVLDGKGCVHQMWSGPWDGDDEITLTTPKTYFIDLTFITSIAGRPMFPVDENVGLADWVYEQALIAEEAWYRDLTPCVIPAESVDMFEGLVLRGLRPDPDASYVWSLLGFTSIETRLKRAGRDSWRVDGAYMRENARTIRVGATRYKLFPSLNWDFAGYSRQRAFAPVAISKGQFARLWDLVTARQFADMTFDDAARALEERAQRGKR